MNHWWESFQQLELNKLQDVEEDEIRILGGPRELESKNLKICLRNGLRRDTLSALLNVDFQDPTVERFWKLLSKLCDNVVISVTLLGIERIHLIEQVSSETQDSEFEEEEEEEEEAAPAAGTFRNEVKQMMSRYHFLHNISLMFPEGEDACERIVNFIVMNMESYFFLREGEIHPNAVYVVLLVLCEKWTSRLNNWVKRDSGITWNIASDAWIEGQLIGDHTKIFIGSTRHIDPVNVAFSQGDDRLHEILVFTNKIPKNASLWGPINVFFAVLTSNHRTLINMDECQANKLSLAFIHRSMASLLRLDESREYIGLQALKEKAYVTLKTASTYSHTTVCLSDKTYTINEIQNFGEPHDYDEYMSRRDNAEMTDDQFREVLIRISNGEEDAGVQEQVPRQGDPEESDHEDDPELDIHLNYLGDEVEDTEVIGKAVKYFRKWRPAAKRLSQSLSSFNSLLELQKLAQGKDSMKDVDTRLRLNMQCSMIREGSGEQDLLTRPVLALGKLMTNDETGPTAEAEPSMEDFEDHVDQTLYHSSKMQRHAERFTNTLMKDMEHHGLVTVVRICEQCKGATNYNLHESLKVDGGWKCPNKGLCTKVNKDKSSVGKNSSLLVYTVSLEVYLQRLFADPISAKIIQSNSVQSTENLNSRFMSFKDGDFVKEAKELKLASFVGREGMSETNKFRAPLYPLINRDRTYYGTNGDDITVTLILSTDGIGIDRRNEVWPIGCSLMELGRLASKQDYIFHLGLISTDYQRKEGAADGFRRSVRTINDWGSIDIFLSCLEDEIARLTVNGVDVYDANLDKIRTVRVVMGPVVGDIPAVSKLTGARGHVSVSPCRSCVLSTVKVKKSVDTENGDPDGLMSEFDFNIILSNGEALRRSMSSLESFFDFIRRNELESSKIIRGGGVYTSKWFNLPKKSNRYKNLSDRMILDYEKKLSRRGSVAEGDRNRNATKTGMELLRKFTGFNRVNRLQRTATCSTSVSSYVPSVDVMHSLLENNLKCFLRLLLRDNTPGGDDPVDGVTLESASASKMKTHVLPNLSKLRSSYGEHMDWRTLKMIGDYRPKAEQLLMFGINLPTILFYIEEGNLCDRWMDIIILFREIMVVAFSHNIPKSDMSEFEGLVKQFVKRIEKLCKKKDIQGVITLNIHEMIHYADQIRAYGPMVMLNTFANERLVGQIKKANNAKRDFAKSISKIHCGYREGFLLISQAVKLHMPRNNKVGDESQWLPDSVDPLHFLTKDIRSAQYPSDLMGNIESEEKKEEVLEHREQYIQQQARKRRKIDARMNHQRPIFDILKDAQLTQKLAKAIDPESDFGGEITINAIRFRSNCEVMLAGYHAKDVDAMYEEFTAPVQSVPILKKWILPVEGELTEDSHLIRMDQVSSHDEKRGGIENVCLIRHADMQATPQSPPIPRLAYLIALLDIELEDGSKRTVAIAATFGGVTQNFAELKTPMPDGQPSRFFQNYMIHNIEEHRRGVIDLFPVDAIMCSCGVAELEINTIVGRRKDAHLFMKETTMNYARVFESASIFRWSPLPPLPPSPNVDDNPGEDGNSDSN